jgi:hypothetical protein
VARGTGSSPVRFTGSGFGAIGSGARGADDCDCTLIFFADDFDEPLR